MKVAEFFSKIFVFFIIFIFTCLIVWGCYSMIMFTGKLYGMCMNFLFQSNGSINNSSLVIVILISLMSIGATRRGFREADKKNFKESK